MPVQVFIAYARADIEYRRALSTHLAPLRMRGIVEDWYDEEIHAGGEWDDEIRRRLDRADMIILLVSADFFASPYITSVEIPRAMERLASGSARVLPVLVRAVSWKHTVIGKLKHLPQNGRPIRSWSDPDQAWAEVTHEVEVVASALAAQHRQTSEVEVTTRDESARRLGTTASDRMGAEPAALSEVRHGDVAYYCYISHDKVDRFAEQLGVRVDDAVVHPVVPYGRPDHYLGRRELRRAYERKLAAVLARFGTIRQFNWGADPAITPGGLWWVTAPFRVGHVDGNMASLIADVGRCQLVLHCSLEYFSDRPIENGQIKLNSTNAAFFGGGLEVSMTACFLWLGGHGQAFVGTPLSLQLQAVPGVLI